MHNKTDVVDLNANHGKECRLRELLTRSFEQRQQLVNSELY